MSTTQAVFSCCLVGLLLFCGNAAGQWADLGKVGFDPAVFVANRCKELALTREEQLATTQIVRDLKINRRPTDEERLIYNALVRDGLRLLLNKKTSILDDAVVQYFFENSKPEVAFAWLDEKLTIDQLNAVKRIKPSEEISHQMARERLQVIAESLHKAKVIRKSKIEGLIGEPYLFVSKELTGDFPVLDYVPDVEPLRVLRSPYVQKHLGLTSKQAGEVVALCREYRERGEMLSTGTGDSNISSEKKEAIRLQAIADAESVLMEDQLNRYREILLQRYFSDTDWGYALRYLDIKPEQKGKEKGKSPET